MTPAELRQIREEMCFDRVSMARALDGMPYRTYQSYEYGDRGIPKEVADKVRELRRNNRQFMAGFRRRLEANLDRLYPAGIPSAPIGDEE